MQKKYFSKEIYIRYINELTQSTVLSEICTNPFYLDIVCLYIETKKMLPQNKAELFTFIVSHLIKREQEKQATVGGVESNGNIFVNTVSSLAYHMSAANRTTTINLDEYLASIRKQKRRDAASQYIALAVRLEIIDHNKQNNEIRFIHHRFQEYFTSLYILNHYKKNDHILPNNAFLNIWWREIILFTAGLETDVDFIANKIIKERDSLQEHYPNLQRILYLECTTLAFETYFANINRQPSKTLESLRKELTQLYETANSLEKVKITRAIKHDNTAATSALLQKSLDDKSPWVSETAFFVLNNGEIYFKMTTTGIIKGLFHFFTEGNSLKILPQMLIAARKSHLLRALFPLYMIFALLTIITIPTIACIFIYLANFLAFDLEYKFQASCLSCLSIIILSMTLSILIFFKNDYPTFKRALATAPAGLMLLYITFNYSFPLPQRFTIAAISLLFFFSIQLQDLW